MPDPGSVGPYEKLSLASGGTVPLYLITFDKEGRCQSPLTLASLLEQVDTGSYTDVHLFSHGWNNVFKDAVGLYRSFFGHYLSQRDQRGLNDPIKYRPLAVGIIWPSTLLVLPWESTPKIAAVVPSPGLDDNEAAAPTSYYLSINRRQEARKQVPRSRTQIQAMRPKTSRRNNSWLFGRNSLPGEPAMVGNPVSRPTMEVLPPRTCLWQLSHSPRAFSAGSIRGVPFGSRVFCR